MASSTMRRCERRFPPLGHITGGASCAGVNVVLLDVLDDVVVNVIVDVVLDIVELVTVEVVVCVDDVESEELDVDVDVLVLSVVVVVLTVIVEDVLVPAIIKIQNITSDSIYACTLLNVTRYK